MSVISNNWTTGHPFTTAGNTGAQSIVHIPATRAFIKAPDSTTAAPVLSYSSYSFKTNGAAPTGWAGSVSRDFAGGWPSGRSRALMQHTSSANNGHLR